jgi:hypothetical protein
MLTFDPDPRLIMKSHGFENENTFCAIGAIIVKAGATIGKLTSNKDIDEMKLLDVVAVYKEGAFDVDKDEPGFDNEM